MTDKDVYGDQPPPGTSGGDDTDTSTESGGDQPPPGTESGGDQPPPGTEGSGG